MNKNKLSMKINYTKNLKTLTHSARRQKIYQFDLEKLNYEGYNVIEKNLKYNEFFNGNEWEKLSEKDFYQIVKKNIQEKFLESSLEFKVNQNKPYLSQIIISFTPSFFEQANILDYNEISKEDNCYKWGIKELYDEKQLKDIFRSVNKALEKQLSQALNYDNFVGSFLHLDEKTPHLHFFFTLIDQNLENKISKKNIPKYLSIRENIITKVNKILNKDNQIDKDIPKENQRNWKKELELNLKELTIIREKMEKEKYFSLEEIVKGGFSENKIIEKEIKYLFLENVNKILLENKHLIKTKTFFMDFEKIFSLYEYSSLKIRKEKVNWYIKTKENIYGIENDLYYKILDKTYNKEIKKEPISLELTRKLDGVKYEINKELSEILDEVSFFIKSRDINILKQQLEKTLLMNRDIKENFNFIYKEINLELNRERSRKYEKKLEETKEREI